MLRIWMSLLIVLLGPALASAQGPSSTKDTWRAVHIMSPGHDGVGQLLRTINEGLAPLGVNVLVLEVNYGFAFQSHPELRSESPLTRDDARELVTCCHENHIRLIPQFNCLGHQSWGKNVFPLLKTYPQFDETPNLPEDAKIYCRSWCPSDPALMPVVTALLDELIDAFEADALHVGMDEVFLIGDDQCPRCKGKPTAELFAKAVNDLHDHVVGKRKLTMLMWSDRFLDDAVMHYGKWESSANGTAPAFDHVPKDIIMCDWHYEMREHYPSVAYFQEKGFRVLPSSWKNPKAAIAFLEDAHKGATERMLGHMGTTWVNANDFGKALLDPESGASASAKGAAESLRNCMKALK